MKAYEELLKIGECFGCRDALQGWFLNHVEVLTSRRSISKLELLGAADNAIFEDMMKRDNCAEMAKLLSEKCAVSEKDESDSYQTTHTYRVYALRCAPR